MRKLNATKTITLGAMCAALTVLCLYAATVLPTGRAALYFVSSLFIYALSSEEAYGGAVVMFFVSCGLGLLIVPNRLALAPYAFLLGHYGIFKPWIDKRMPDRVVASALKLLYCNAFFALAVCVAVYVFHFDLSSLSLPIPLWAVIPLMQPVFLAFDLLYWICQRFYDERIRSAIMPRR